MDISFNCMNSILNAWSDTIGFSDSNDLLPLSVVQQLSFVEFVHEIISTAILLLPLIQERQLSVTGERMCTKYW